ncbi:MAG: hypothetical protein U0V70_05675 [Terriglobia bacterium]
MILGQRWAEEYEEYGVRIQVTGGGSGVGNRCSHQWNNGHHFEASRPMKGARKSRM